MSLGRKERMKDSTGRPASASAARAHVPGTVQAKSSSIIQPLMVLGKKVNIRKLSLTEAQQILTAILEGRPVRLWRRNAQWVATVEEGDEQALRERIRELGTDEINNNPPITNVSPGHAPTVNQLQLQVKGGVISGLEILRWIHPIVQEYIDEAKTNISMPKTSENSFCILGGPSWLSSAGKMAGDFSHSGIDKYEKEQAYGSIKVSSSSTKVELQQRGKTERLYFSGSDPSYEKIMELRNRLRYMTDAQIAAALLHKMRSGAHYQYMQQETIELLDGLNALLFGVEGSRNNDSFATNVMLLELIMAAQMTFQQAFAQNDFGGQYPMASLSTGSGNFSARRKFIEGKTTTRQINTMRKDPQKHQVPLKEIILIINWLIHRYGGTLSNMTRKEAEVYIKQAVRQLMEENYGGSSTFQIGTGFVTALDLSRKRKRSNDDGNISSEDTRRAKKKKKNLSPQELEERRQWWRAYLNKRAKQGLIAANMVIMAIITGAEPEEDILDRLYLGPNGEIMGFLRGG